MSLAHLPPQGALVALGLALVAALLAAIAARWLNHVDTEGDDWHDSVDQSGFAVPDVPTPAVPQPGDHHA